LSDKHCVEKYVWKKNKKNPTIVNDLKNCLFVILNTLGQSRMDNPEKLATLGTQDTG
jgi:hypothetical protein